MTGWCEKAVKMKSNGISVIWYRHTVFDSTTVSYEEKVQNIEKVFLFLFIVLLWKSFGCTFLSGEIVLLFTFTTLFLSDSWNNVIITLSGVKVVLI